MTWAPRNKSEDEDEEDGDGERKEVERSEKTLDNSEASAEDEGGVLSGCPGHDQFRVGWEGGGAHFIYFTSYVLHCCFMSKYQRDEIITQLREL